VQSPYIYEIHVTETHPSRITKIWSCRFSRTCFIKPDH